MATTEATAQAGSADCALVLRLAEEFIVAEKGAEELEERFLQLPDVLGHLLRGAGGADAVVQALRLAMGWHGSFVHKHLGGLPQDCYNFLAFWEEPAGPCREYADRLLKRLRQTNLCWLRQLYGPPPSPVQTMAEHTGPVNALAVDGAGWVISGSWDGTVKRWNPATGGVRTFRAGAEVPALVVYHDLPVVVGGLRSGHILAIALEPDADRHTLPEFHPPIT